MSTNNLCFQQKYEKYQSFFISKFSVFGDEIFYLYLNRRVLSRKQTGISCKLSQREMSEPIFLVETK